MPASRAVRSGHRRNGVDMQHLFQGRAKHWRFPLLLILHVYSFSYLQAALSVTETSESITIHVGSGGNVSYLAFAEPSLNPKAVIYAWHYDEPTNPNTPPRTGLDLYDAVHVETAGSPWALSYSTGDFGLTTSFSMGQTTSRVVNPLANPGPVWTYWIQGGNEYVEYGDNDTTFTFLVGNFLIVSPAYWDTRYISNGSLDAWTITRFSFSEAPSDTHEYTDILGKAQTVTYGTYEGPAPSLIRPPKLLSSGVLPDGQLQIVFSVMEGGVYQLQTQDGLSPNGWQNFEPTYTATTTEKTYTLPINNSIQRRFFRLVRRE